MCSRRPLCSPPLALARGPVGPELVELAHVGAHDPVDLLGAGREQRVDLRFRRRVQVDHLERRLGQRGIGPAHRAVDVPLNQARGRRRRVHGGTREGVGQGGRSKGTRQGHEGGGRKDSCRACHIGSPARRPGAAGIGGVAGSRSFIGRTSEQGPSCPRSRFFARPGADGRSRRLSGVGGPRADRGAGPPRRPAPERSRHCPDRCRRRRACPRARPGRQPRSGGTRHSRGSTRSRSPRS
jgi:hypothetical protein